MSNVVFRDTKKADVLWLAAHMREEDKQEIAAAAGRTPVLTLLAGYEHSPFIKTMLVDGVPALIFGVAHRPGDGMVGTVWMLASDYLMSRDAVRAIKRTSKYWADEMNKLYPILANVADRRNKTHLRWIKFCGFTFINEVYLGPVNAPFLEFVRIRPCAT